METSKSPLAELFPDGDYRFHLTLKRSEPRAFFAPQDLTGAVLAERARWLREAPERYAALQPEAEAAFAELAVVVAEWGWGNARTMAELGALLEPDVIILVADAEGRFRLRAGALCFPTGWALEEKLGQPIEVIHGVVPGLNPVLESPIQQFLTKLRPGMAFLRDNWGLAANAELNLHPARALAPPNPPVALDQLWLRVEHQALLALPRSRAIVFGIRIALHRLEEVVRDRAAADGLKRALDTMPADLAAYKRLDTVRADVSRLL